MWLCALIIICHLLSITIIYVTLTLHEKIDKDVV